MRWVLGVDLASARDYSAMCLVERVQIKTGEREYHDGKAIQIEDKYETELHVRNVRRLPRTYSYLDVARHIRMAVEHPSVAGDIKVVVDVNGPGRPVVHLLREEGLHVLPVCATGGRNEALSKDQTGIETYNVAKKILVFDTVVAFQNARLLVSEELQHKDLLIRELNTYKMKMTGAGNETFSAWHERDHDDLVSALTLCVWFCNRYPKRGWQVSKHKKNHPDIKKILVREDELRMENAASKLATVENERLLRQKYGRYM
mgnify:FL=1